MAENTISLKVLLEADTANMKLGQLEEHFAALQERIREVPRGSKEFDQLSHSIARTSAEIKNIELGFEGLDREGVASQLGGLAGGIGEVTASLVLMGGENETMQEMAASIEKAMAISMGFKGAIEGLSAAKKLYNNLLKKGKVQVMAKAAAEKVAAVGTLASDEAIAQEKAAEKKIKSYQKQAKELEKLREAHERLSKKVLGDLEYELELLKAKGEDTAEAEWDIVNQKKKAALEAKRIAIDEYKNSQKLLDLRKAQNKEITDEELEAHNELVKNLKAAGAAYIEAKREQTIFFANRKRERKEERDKEAEADKKAQAEASKRRKEQREKDKAAKEKAAADQKKIDEKAAEDAIQLEKDKIQLLEDLEAKAIEDKNVRALAELELAQERERQQLIEKYGEDTELMLALEEEQLLQMNTLIEGIEQEARDKKIAADLADAELKQIAKDKELQDIQDIADAKQKAREEGLVAATQVIDSLSSLNEMALQNDLKNAGDNEAKKEQLRKASFEREKKLNIAMALVNGAQAQMSILAQTPKADFGIATAIAMAAAAVTTIAQIAAIKATSYQGGGSPVASESASVPSAGGAGAAGGGAAITPVSNTSTILGGQQVFVTETDITETQNNVSVIEESATF
jgi:hypothetical protein